MNRLIFNLIFILFSTFLFGQENCRDGIDNDGDGKIDLNDSECVCLNSTSSSLISNNDFEQMNFCPNDFAKFNAVKNWFLPSTSTTDYINSCGFVPASAIDAGIFPLPTSNGNGVSGMLVTQDYKEFIGICTNKTLLAGTKYQINFDIASSTSGRILDTNPNIGEVCNHGLLNAGKIDISLYGRFYCDTTIPSNSNNFPIGWQLIGYITYLPSKNWNQLSIIFTPSNNVNSIMIGSPYSLPNSYLDQSNYWSCFPYFYIDNVELNEVSDLGLKINPIGSFCENSIILNAEVDSSIGNNYALQWYKNGVAIAGATNSSLKVNFEINNQGNYQFKIINSSLCKTSPFYNINTVIDVPNYAIDQSPCFPGVVKKLTITTPADEYSFDNGITWTNNPSLENIIPFFYNVNLLIKKNGCVSNTRHVVFDNPSTDTITNVNFNITQPGCQTNGSITISTPALAYSFDDGKTWTDNPTLDNLPPNYKAQIKIKTLLGCITETKYIMMLPFNLPEPSITSTDFRCGVGGSITITTKAEEYSIDGGENWSSSPTFLNLSPNTYRVMVKNEFTCTSLIQYVYIGTEYVTTPEVVYTEPQCGTLGTITVITKAAEYSFDDGITWTNNNIAKNLNPGAYFVKIKDSQNCISYSKFIYIQPFILDIEIEYSTINSNCTNNGTINISTIAKEYSIDNGMTWSESSKFTQLSSGFYLLMVRNEMNCESQALSLYLQDFSNINPEYDIINAGCNTFGSLTITTDGDLYSFDNGNIWTPNNTISNLTGNIEFVIMVKKNECVSQPFNVNFNSNFLPNPTISDYQVSLCDVENDRVETLNLTDYSSFLIDNSSNYLFYYFTEYNDAQNLNLNNQIQNIIQYEVNKDQSPIYVTIVSNDNCSNIAKFNFKLLDSPILTTLSDKFTLCQNSNITINPNNFTYSYLWSDGSTLPTLEISKSGNYYVTASINYGSNICFTKKNFIVTLSNEATITSIETKDWTDTENTILVNTIGIGDYEFSIDGANYQEENIFTNLNNGEFTLYVRDKNGCGIINESIYLLMYPKFFTPNGDGIHDTWSINLSVHEPNLKINIFDRDGKLIKELKSSDSWDGSYNGFALPSTDYWFIVTRKNGKEYKGHFTLKR